MNTECIFCKIAAKQIPAKLIYDDSEVFAFDDIGPQAPTHLLICPRKHIESLDATTEADAAILGKLLTVAVKLGRERNLTNGYRTVINNGEHGGQSVAHLHVHLLGGRPMRWPPG
jgi:histidine triad (HIT) family protein